MGTTVAEPYRQGGEQADEKQHLRDEVLRLLWRKRRACAADLANDLAEPLPADDLVPVVKRLEADGVVRKVIDRSRAFKDPEQTIYEVVR